MRTNFKILIVWLIGLMTLAGCSWPLATVPAANSSAPETQAASLQLIEFYSPM